MHLRQTDPANYVLGHSDGELARLETQAEIFAAQTEDILRRAGLQPGMRVLDIGCGVGDVSLAAGRMVGPDGAVVGIDNASNALFLARARAKEAGLDHLTFVEADVQTFADDRPFDALVGRFILMHLPEPAATIGRLVANVSPGGAIAFIEMDIEQAGAEPPLPLLDKCLGWILDTYRKVGVEPNMGSRMYGTFLEAGLEASMVGSCRIEGSREMVTFQFVAESLRTLLPAMEEHGIATGRDVGADILADRLQKDAIAGRHCIFFPRVVGAWATVPG